MKKCYVKVASYKVRRVAKPDKGYLVIKSMTNNVNFPAAETADMLTNLQTASDKLSAVNTDAGSGNHALIAIANEKELVFVTALNVVARYVQTKADADPVNSNGIIQSAGFEVRKSPEKAKAPASVEKMAAEFTNVPGTISLAWKCDKYAKTYIVFMTETPEVADSWKQVDVVATRKLMVNGLASGKRYYFRVTAKGLAGSGEPSDIVSQVAA